MEDENDIDGEGEPDNSGETPIVKAKVTRRYGTQKNLGKEKETPSEKEEGTNDSTQEEEEGATEDVVNTDKAEKLAIEDVSGALQVVERKEEGTKKVSVMTEIYRLLIQNCRTLNKRRWLLQMSTRMVSVFPRSFIRYLS